jgi:hypothetical protein
LVFKKFFSASAEGKVARKEECATGIGGAAGFSQVGKTP